MGTCVPEKLLVFPRLVVKALVVERYPFGFEPRNQTPLCQDEFHYPPANMGLNLQLPHEWRLVFGANYVI